MAPKALLIHSNTRQMPWLFQIVQFSARLYDHPSDCAIPHPLTVPRPTNAGSRVLSKAARGQAPGGVNELGVGIVDPFGGVWRIHAFWMLSI